VGQILQLSFRTSSDKKRDENIVEGKSMLESELKKSGLYFNDSDVEDIFPKI